MIRTMAAALLAVPLIAAAAGSAAAASCATKFLEGVWVGHATTEVDLYCLVALKPNGRTSQSSCFDPSSLKPTASLDGRITVSSDCDAKGSFTFTSYGSGKTSPAIFKGKMNASKGILNGDFVIFGENEDYKFYKQLD